MKKFLSILFVSIMIVGLIPPHAVRASGISDPVQAVRESTSWEPMNSERIEVPSEAEKLTVDWLNRNYSITESSIMEQLGKGYSLTDIHQALKKDSNGKHLESGLDKINSQVKIQWDQIRDSINLTQIKDEPLRSNLKSKLSDEKLTELLKSSEKKLDSGVRKSESPERDTEEIGTDHSKEAFQSKGLTTMAAGDPPLPNLASNYDQAAANQLNVRTNQAPFSISNGGEHISTMTGDLTLANTDLTLPGRNWLSFSLNRVYNSSDAKYYEDDVAWRIYQRKWLFRS